MRRQEESQQDQQRWLFAAPAATRSGGPVEAASEEDALGLLPPYVAERTTITRVSEVEIP